MRSLSISCDLIHACHVRAYSFLLLFVVSPPFLPLLPACLPACSFDSVTDLLEPTTDGRTNNCYISKSYDAASHFETCADDVLSLYSRITGTELDMNISAEMTEEDM